MLPCCAAAALGAPLVCRRLGSCCDERRFLRLLRLLVVEHDLQRHDTSRCCCPFFLALENRDPIKQQPAGTPALNKSRSSQPRQKENLSHIRPQQMQTTTSARTHCAAAALPPPPAGWFSCRRYYPGACRASKWRQYMARSGAPEHVIIEARHSQQQRALLSFHEWLAVRGFAPSSTAERLQQPQDAHGGTGLLPSPLLSLAANVYRR